MKYANIIENDVVNCMEGITVSLFMSGCPHHCKNCFNQETWNPNFGIEIEINELCNKLNDLINAYNVHRDFSLLGGEPLAEYNRKNTQYIIQQIKHKNPNIVIYLWTGYSMEELKSMNDSSIDYILSTVNYLIDGRYEDNKKDSKLKMRGSSNQKIYHRINGELRSIHI